MSIIQLPNRKGGDTMVRVTVSRGNAAIPVPHVADVVGISDKRGRFAVWDAINKALCYDVQGNVTVRWPDVHLPASVRGKLVVSHSPGR